MDAEVDLNEPAWDRETPWGYKGCENTDRAEGLKSPSCTLDYGSRQCPSEKTGH